MNIIGRDIILLPYDGKDPIKELGTDLGMVMGREIFNGEKYYEVMLSIGEQTYVEPDHCKSFDPDEHKKV